MAKEEEQVREYEYAEGSEKGPAHWGDLKPEWSACKTGTMQSPIDIISERVKEISKSGDLETNYKPCNAILRNRGHDISLKWSDNNAGTVKVNGTDYMLDQVHWHSPSEHTINGQRNDLELHMVHRNIDKVAVIGLL
ncbi:alpha carbonic anhydrase 7-like [Mangifera indica]|uniref:alpha carbonic anhydrase 7-like n=1 Tax=Mangifera indica TaxID=29780 RepID=UPI001CF973BE|nr:alpha carbonic anhydrase 7-like [Mangifera indica]